MLLCINFFYTFDRYAYATFKLLSHIVEILMDPSLRHHLMQAYLQDKKINEFLITQREHRIYIFSNPVVAPFVVNTGNNLILSQIRVFFILYVIRSPKDAMVLYICKSRILKTHICIMTTNQRCIGCSNGFLFSNCRFLF